MFNILLYQRWGAEASSKQLCATWGHRCVASVKSGMRLASQAFVGVDSFQIDFDGLLYRGVCHNDGPIGHISKQINFSNAPTVCKKQWCTSNVDQTVRKAQPEFLHLITKS